MNTTDTTATLTVQDRAAHLIAARDRLIATVTHTPAMLTTAEARELVAIACAPASSPPAAIAGATRARTEGPRSFSVGVDRGRAWAGEWGLLEVIYVRDDGWSLGADPRHADTARKQWADLWVLEMRVPRWEPVPFVDLDTARGVQLGRDYGARLAWGVFGTAPRATWMESPRIHPRDAALYTAAREGSPAAIAFLAGAIVAWREARAAHTAEEA